MTTKEPSSASSASRSGRPLPTFVALLTHPWVRSPPAASRGAPKRTACLDEDRLVPLRRWPRGWRPSKSVLEAPTVAARQPAPPDPQPRLSRIWITVRAVGIRQNGQDHSPKSDPNPGAFVVPVSG